MTGSKYLLRVAKVVGIILALPVIAFLCLGLVDRNTGIGLGYLLFFIGLPLTLLVLAVSLAIAAKARVRSSNLPSILWWGQGPLILANWEFFLWLFRPFHAPFVAVALVAAVHIAINGQSSSGSPAIAKANTAFVAIFTAVVGIAVLRIATFAGYFFNLLRFDYDFMLRSYGGQLALAAALILSGLAIFIRLQQKK